MYGVPQETSPELFKHMVSDLHSDTSDVKHMDETTHVDMVTKHRKGRGL